MSKQPPKVADKRVKEAAGIALHARNFKQLSESMAWQEIVDMWQKDIKNFESEKTGHSYYDYSPDARIPFGNDAKGNPQYINGLQYLAIMQREEVKMEVYRETIALVADMVRKGEESVKFLQENVHVNDVAKTIETGEMK